MLLSKILG